MSSKRPTTSKEGKRVALALFVLFVLLFSRGPASSTEFLRGDANADGEVTLSDAHSIQNFLFRGGWPIPCRKAMDVDANGKVNITDTIRLLNFGFRGGSPPEAPFPEPGAERPAGGGGGALECDAYEVGPPLVDPAARLAVLRAEAPGGSEGHVKVTLAVSSSAPLAGLAGDLLLDAGIAGTVEPIGSPLIELGDSPGFNSVNLDGGAVRFGFLSTLVGIEAIPAGNAVAVLELTICLQDGTPAGEYPLRLSGVELVDFETGRAIRPATSDGVLVLESDVAAGAGCEPFVPGEPGGEDCRGTGNAAVPDPLPAVNASFELASARAAAGEEATLPFSIVADAPVQAYSFSVDFDEEVLEPLGVDIVFDIDRTPPPSPPCPTCPGYFAGFEKITINDAHEVPGSGGIDEGYIVGALVFSFIDNCHNIPPNRQTEALDFRFRVRPGTPATSTEVAFADGGQGEGAPLKNVITAYGHAWSPETAGSFIFVNGRVNVLPEVVVFIRGNANGDAVVDISDPQWTLAYLFLGGQKPKCFDAADANDDGRLDIADPVATLMYLFLGGPPLAAPFPEEGLDPTEDRITCSTRP